MPDSDDEPFPLPGVDLTRPSVARIYDHYLGGTTNWEVDRQFAERVLRDYPVIRSVAHANRMFQRRVVRHLVRLGIRQFIDIGSGVPTMGHVHEVGEQVAPGEVRVAHVDHEPVAVDHATLLLQDDGDPTRHAAVHADMRDPHRVWSRVADTGVLDLGRPTAVLLMAVLHIQQPPPPGSDDTEDLGPRLVATYRDLLVPGSYLSLSHVTDTEVSPRSAAMLGELKGLYANSVSPAVFRDRGEITALFGDFTLLEPGVTWAPDWHPEEAGEHDHVVDFSDSSGSLLLVGTGRK